MNTSRNWASDHCGSYGETDFIIPLSSNFVIAHAFPQTKLVLIKANICRNLEPRLAKSFNVLNRGIVIPFPSSGQQMKFQEAIRSVLRLE